MGEELPLPQKSPERQSGQQSLTYGEQLRSPNISGNKLTSEYDETREIKSDASGAPRSTVTADDKNTTVVINASSVSVNDDSNTTVLDNVPMIAADDDLIEKQWVEATKKIVEQTKSDPFAQARAVGKLQADYLSKRYGKIIKLKEDVL